MSGRSRLLLLVALRLAVAPAPALAAPAAGAPAAVAPPAPAMDGLQGTLATLVAGWSGDYAVSVMDLQTGQSVAVNGGRQQSAASTIKLAIVMAVAAAVAAGRLTQADVDPLVQVAMGPSDNDAARELLFLLGDGDAAAGIGRVNDLLRALGATGSVLSTPPDYPEEDVGLAPDNLLTTDDLVTVLAKLYRGQALPPAATGYVLDSMTLPEPWQNALGAPLPAGATLYHKPGWHDDPPTWNDAGLVIVRRAGQSVTYAIAVLGTGAEDLATASDHVASVSAAVWQYFAAAYPDPQYRYFPATGHTVGNGFLHFWEQFGDLAVFGYPLTDERVEHGVTIQYFERARFEWHPGAAPDRYDVLLGRLGAELAQKDLLLPRTAFQPVRAGSDASCTFYAATGHRVCDGFRDYWEAHGGLAIFGYPISEEFRQNGADVQYFERARFEYRPGAAPEVGDVLLGRLGAEELTARSRRGSASLPAAPAAPRYSAATPPGDCVRGRPC